ncbi:MAG: Spx/MgsR family RNA polymerase-binding regulatory protein [Myxococcota bacterium]
MTLYGISTCDTCRKAKAWFEDRSVSYRWVDLRDQPPDSERIARWVGSIGSKPLRNTSGRSYRALGDVKKAYDDTAWIAAFAADPMLLKRPVVEWGAEVVCAGFRPEELERVISGE